MKKLFLLSAMMYLAASGAINAQSVYFGYDNAGNRISRTIVMSPSNAPAKPNGNQEPVVEQFSDNLQVKIYPNPTEGQLRLEIVGIDENDNVSYSLINLNGQTLIYQPQGTADEMLNLSPYPSGVYILRLNIKGDIIDYKIIKQ
jgi:hypothetical protein